jgi:hypothetical protein
MSAPSPVKTGRAPVLRLLVIQAIALVGALASAGDA